MDLTALENCPVCFREDHKLNPYERFLKQQEEDKKAEEAEKEA